MIFTTSPDALYESYSSESIPHKDTKLSILFETQEIMEETLILLRFNCPDSDCDYIGNGWGDLKLHVRATHGKLLWYSFLWPERKQRLIFTFPATSASVSKKSSLMNTRSILRMCFPYICHRCINEPPKVFPEIKSRAGCILSANSAGSASSAATNYIPICGSATRSASFANGTRSEINSA